MSDLTLYMSPSSSSMAAHIALREIGVPFATHVVSVSRKETESAAYLAVNPEGKVPLLVADSQKITEVAGILYYLARRFPGAKLMPFDDVDTMAQIVSWMSFIASTIHPARRQGIEHARGVYKLADQRLGRNDWAVGGRFSIADIHLFRLFWRFSGSLHPPRESFPNLYAHLDRMLARPAVQKTLQAEAAIGYELPA